MFLFAEKQMSPRPEANVRTSKEGGGNGQSALADRFCFL